MTYQNRGLTTHEYLNQGQSYFWSFMASDIAYKLGERCEHSNRFTNMILSSRIERIYNIDNLKDRSYDKLAINVKCKKCGRDFFETGRILPNIVGNYGF